MGFGRDAALIEEVVRYRDPAFANVPPKVLSDAVHEMKARAKQDDLEAFLLAAMRTMAVAGNAHSRLIPNAAISVLPLRFVVRDNDLCVVREDVAVRVLTVNGTGIAHIMSVWRASLAGPAVRRLVLSGLMLAWPAALAEAGVIGPDYDYALADGTHVVVSSKEIAPASRYFSENETGALLPGADAYPQPLVAREGAIWRVRLADLKTLTNYDITQVVRALQSNPSGVIVDLRGNPGGSFLTALPLVHMLRDAGQGVRCAVLVNGYTFSAALVVAALIASHLGQRATLTGSDMGDDLAFWAEGDLLQLPDSGAKLRYSSAWHDWQTGVADATTPPEIEAHLVAAGVLPVQRVLEAEQEDVARAFLLRG
ncbi:S41 family peptidase [uncultured Tateyamaria sp.]|uniref:S41 family peptidase n=1 Tax=uncultured Tateyamaria sp. TaxID=455651 RepID=UPI0026251322|nr:S41 family peptidase [uncultured Tateyamaria sp.]